MSMPSRKHGTEKPVTQERRSQVRNQEQETRRQGVTTETALQRVRQTPRSPSPAELLQLQRAVGNRAVGRLVGDLARTPEETLDEPAEEVVARIPGDGTTRAPEGAVQRKSWSGLARRKLSKGFGKAAFNFWKDEANKDKPLRDLSDHLMAEVNKLLPFPCLWTYPAGLDASGTFDRTVWMIRLNADLFTGRPGVTKVSQLEKGEVAEIVDTVYHEARHSEQYFQIARLQAGEGKNPFTIMSDMSIPFMVAFAAAQDPLTDDTKANRRLMAEAREWEQITVGKYGDYKGHVYGVMDDAKAIQDAAVSDPSDAVALAAVGPTVTAAEIRINTFFNPQQTTIEAIPKRDRDKFDKNVLKRVIKIKKAFKKIKDEYTMQVGDPTKQDALEIELLASEYSDAGYKAYKAFEHEKDTWAVGEAAARRFKRNK
jgi:hypothetical protein